MTWVDLLALGLATAGVVDTWLNGSVFAEKRAEIDDWSGLLGELLRCDFCLSRQLPFWLIVLCVVPSLALDANGHPYWATAVKLPIYFFAAGEIAWLNNLLRGEDRGFSRTQIKVTSPDEPSRIVATEHAPPPPDR